MAVRTLRTPRQLWSVCDRHRSQDYNTYISQLMGAAGLGTTANQGLQTATRRPRTTSAACSRTSAKRRRWLHGRREFCRQLVRCERRRHEPDQRCWQGAGKQRRQRRQWWQHEQRRQHVRELWRHGERWRGSSTGIPYDIENPGTGTTPTTTTSMRAIRSAYLAWVDHI